MAWRIKASTNLQLKQFTNSIFIVAYVCVAIYIAGYIATVILYIILFMTVSAARFEQPTYSVNENAGAAQPAVILSNPSTTDITVQVMSRDGTASG